MIKMPLKGKRLDSGPALDIYKHSFTEYPFKNLCRWPSYWTIPLWYELKKASAHLPTIPRMAMDMMLNRTPGIVFYNIEKNWGARCCCNSASILNERQFQDVTTLQLAWFYFHHHGIIILRAVYQPTDQSRTEEDKVYQYFAWDGDKLYELPNTLAVAMVLKLMEGRPNANWVEEDLAPKLLKQLNDMYCSTVSYSVPAYVQGRFPCIVRSTPAAVYYQNYQLAKEQYYAKRRNTKRDNA